ncbi:hypothetical protein KSP24_02910 [Paenibacillus sp. AK121]|uniref:hypothetical protein n=1 Tax=Paenibacillus sp. AK121 TaxID=2849670 RepID=UPI001C21812C|nr:hypothetical protein [Paenibacillus sp. AK121]MBU9705875.1 hypothetical protein [Paenibacillus sp. AK121]
MPDNNGPDWEPPLDTRRDTTPHTEPPERPEPDHADPPGQGGAFHRLSDRKKQKHTTH